MAVPHAERHPHPYLQNEVEFLRTLESQAVSIGISPSKARDQIIMRLDLA